MIVDRPTPRLRALAGDSAPEIPLLNRPLLLYQLAFLRRHGVARVILASAGGVPPAMDDVAAVNGDRGATQSVLVVDGDVVTDADVSRMLRFHAERSAAATVMLARDRRAPQGRIRDGGVYVVDASHLGPLLAMRPTAGQPGFLAMLLAARIPCAGWYSAAYSRRIRTPAAYHAAHMDLLGGRVSMLVDPPGRPVDGSWIGDDVTIRPDAAIVPPSVIGAGAELRAGTRVGPRAVIGAHSRLEPGARVTESVLGDGVVVGASATLDGCVVGSGARIAPFSILAPGAVLARGAVLRSRTLLPR